MTIKPGSLPRQGNYRNNDDGAKQAVERFTAAERELPEQPSEPSVVKTPKRSNVSRWASTNRFTALAEDDEEEDTIKPRNTATRDDDEESIESIDSALSEPDDSDCEATPATYEDDADTKQPPEPNHRSRAAINSPPLQPTMMSHRNSANKSRHTTDRHPTTHRTPTIATNAPR
jgi:hypothetical protein